jgi:metal-responsive CopG/Arc/MetJ family transcriptional regulator
MSGVRVRDRVSGRQRFRTISLPEILMQHVKEYRISENREGYTSDSQIVQAAIREFLQRRNWWRYNDLEEDSKP